MTKSCKVSLVLRIVVTPYPAVLNLVYPFPSQNLASLYFRISLLNLSVVKVFLNHKDSPLAHLTGLNVNQIRLPLEFVIKT